MVLGSEVCEPIIETYRSKLRSHTHSASAASVPTRKTPRFLGIIATPDDERPSLQKAWKGDKALLKWDVVKEYLGSTADLAKLRKMWYSSPVSVLSSPKTVITGHE